MVLNDLFRLSGGAGDRIAHLIVYNNGTAGGKGREAAEDGHATVVAGGSGGGGNATVVVGEHNGTTKEAGAVETKTEANGTAAVAPGAVQPPRPAVAAPAGTAVPDEEDAGAGDARDEEKLIEMSRASRPGERGGGRRHGGPRLRHDGLGTGPAAPDRGAATGLGPHLVHRRGRGSRHERSRRMQGMYRCQ